MTISQTASPWSRVLAFVSSGVYQPMYRPTVTAASTAETSSASAGR